MPGLENTSANTQPRPSLRTSSRPKKQKVDDQFIQFVPVALSTRKHGGGRKPGQKKRVAEYNEKWEEKFPAWQKLASAQQQRDVHAALAPYLHAQPASPWPGAQQRNTELH
ncbi:hypothetical protein N2152v2_003379 [Parachlorella kessleri]